MRQAARLALVALGAGAVVVVALAWRLSRAPIALTSLGPTIERALAAPDGAVTVRLGGLELAWAGPRRGLELRARQVRVAGRDGVPIATLPVVAIRPSIRALLRGRVALRAVRLVGPRLRVVRDADGRVRLAPAGGSPSDPAPPFPATASDSLLGQLRRIEILNGQVVLIDRAARATWRARHVDLVLRRDGDAVVGHLEARLALGRRYVPLGADARHAASGSELTAHVASFRPTDAADLARRGSPLAAALARIDVPLDATVRVALDDALRPAGVEVEATGGRGTIAVPEIPAGAVAVEALAASVREHAGAIEVEHLTLDLGEPAIEMHGTADAETLAAKIALRELATDTLGRYWPVDSAPEARAWVLANITGGHVREARAELAATRDAGGWTLGSPSGTLHFDGLAVRLFGALPRATRVAGTATLRDGRASFHVARGRVGGLELVRATADVSSGRTPAVAIDGVVRGPVAAALAVLDAEPLGVARRVGVVPASTEGRTTARVTLAVPLRGPITFASVGLTASGELRGVAVPRIVRGWSLAAGDLDMTLDARALTLTGTARLEGTPVQLTWREELDAGRTTGRQLDARGRFDSAGRAALGVGLSSLDGPVDATVRLVQTGGALGHLDLDVDLTPATLTLAVLDLEKPAGAAGDVHARLTLAGQAIGAIDDFRLRAGSSSVTGRATLAPDGRTPRTADAAATISPRRPDEAAGHFALAVRPDPRGNHFRLTSDDAGALLRALGRESDAEDGALVVDGWVNLDDDAVPLGATVDVRDFRVTRSPLLAKLGTLTSLSGIGTALTGGGVPFSHATATLAHAHEQVTITDGAARGPSVALTFGGTIDRRADTLALRGTFVPSYFGLNKAAGRVPIVGRLVTGGEKEGFQVIDFQVRGSPASPEVSVNPVSSLAPGALRDLLRRLER